MRFGDHVWPAMGLAWLPALIPGLLSLLHDGPPGQVGGLLHLGTLVLTPILFVMLYYPALALAGFAGWPRAPASARRRPRLAFAFTALGLGFLLPLGWFVTGIVAGDVPMNDFCRPVLEEDGGGAALPGLTFRIEHGKTLVCLLDAPELGFNTVAIGLPLALAVALGILLPYGLWRLTAHLWQQNRRGSGAPPPGR